MHWIACLCPILGRIYAGSYGGLAGSHGIRGYEQGGASIGPRVHDRVDGSAHVYLRAFSLEILSKYLFGGKFSMSTMADCVQPTNLVLFVLEPYSEFSIFQKVI